MRVKLLSFFFTTGEEELQAENVRHTDQATNASEMARTAA